MLAAPMHGKGVDELVGDDVRAHRNTRRVIHSVVAALASLLLLLSATALLATRTSANLQSKLSLIETILPFFDKSAQDDENLDRPPWATLWQTLARQLTPVSAVEQRVDWGPERLAMREDCRLYEDVSDADRRFECPQNNSAYGADGLRNDIEGLRQIVEQLLVDLNSGRVAKLLGADSSLQAIAGADDSVTEPDADISTDQAAADRSSGSQSEVTLTVVHEFASILLPEPLWAQLRFKGLRKSRDDNELYGRYFRLHVHAIENGVLPTALVLVQMEDGGYCGSGGCQSPSLGFLRRGSDYTLVWVNPLWGRVILYPQGPGNMPRILAFGTSQSGASSQFRQVIRYDFDAELGQYQPSLRGQIESNESHGDPRVPGLAASSAAARPSLAPSKPSASELTHR
jgi:hypothetical protein